MRKKNESEKKEVKPKKLGRPRTCSPDTEQCHELGKEMVEWVRENQPSHLSEWYSIEKMILWKDFKNLCDNPDFSPYYELALSLIARNLRNECIDKSFGNRFLALYHRDLRAYDHEELQIQSALRQKENQIINEEDRKRFDELMTILSKKQN